jgi:hypothetical protein
MAHETKVKVAYTTFSFQEATLGVEKVGEA